MAEYSSEPFKPTHSPELSDEQELSAEEENRFDYLMESQHKNAAEARAEILAARPKKPGIQAVAETVQIQPESTSTGNVIRHPRYSHRGGRSYPDPHDWEIEQREADTQPIEVIDESDQEAMRLFFEQSHAEQDANEAKRLQEKGYSQVHIDAILRKRREERNQRHSA